MPILVDGYNCLHGARSFGGVFAGADLRRLCMYARGCREGVTVVLDGGPKPDEPGAAEVEGITLRYSGASVEADAVIAQIIDRSPHRKRFTVVTDDRAVANHARSRGARVLPCAAFLEKLVQAESVGRLREHPEKTRGRMPPGLVDHWMREFGFHGKRRD